MRPGRDSSPKLNRFPERRGERGAACRSIPIWRMSRSSSTAPTTVSSPCAARPARCCRACSTWGRAAPSSRARSATSSCARVSPAWNSSTSATRRSTSGASTAFPTPTPTPTVTVTVAAPGRVTGPCSGSRSTSVAWPCPVLITSPWWWTGGPRWPSRSTGPRDSTPRAWPDAATWPSAAAPCSGSRTSTSSTRRGHRGRRCSRFLTAPSPTGTHRASGCFPKAWCLAAPAPSSPHSARPAPGTWATSSGPSRGSRTRSSAPR